MKLTGKCLCNNITEGEKCDKCKLGYYGDLDINPCKKCECDTIGTNPNSLIKGTSNYICNTVTGYCNCNINRIGSKCDSCGPGYFYLNAILMRLNRTTDAFSDIDCYECNCDPVGSIPGSSCIKYMLQFILKKFNK